MRRNRRNKIQMNRSIQLFKTLPIVLKVSWIMLLLGAAGLVLGYFTTAGWLSFTGLNLLAFGLLIPVFDMFARKSPRSQVAGFYTGIVVAPLFSFLVFILLLILVSAAILLDWFLGDGFSGHGVLHVLHLAGVLTGLFMVVIIPKVAFSVGDQREEEQTEEFNQTS